MNKVLVLSASDTLDSLKDDFLTQKIQLINKTFSSIQIEIIDGKVDVMVDDTNIDEYNFIWLMSPWPSKVAATAVDMYLKNKGKSYTPVEYEVSKLSDYVAMALDNVSVPNTFYSTTCTLSQNIDQIEKVCNYPVIVKIVNGSLGKDMFLANNKSELVEVIENKLKEDKHYVCQEFIPNEVDYRIVLSNNKILVVRRRRREASEFRNNTDLGATAVDVDFAKVDLQLKQLAINAAKAIKLDWTGIDVVQSLKNEKYYVLELNRRPGITKDSTELVASERHLLDLLRGNGALDK